MRKYEGKRWLLPLCCYLLGAVAWLVGCGVHLVRDTLQANSGALTRQQLDFYDFDDQFGLLAPEDFAAEGWFASTDPDPQLILYFDGGRYVTNFTFAGKTLNRGSGELVLYYTTEAGEDFSEHKKLWAKQAADGTWIFDVGGRTLSALRFDAASYAGVYWQVDAMVLNEYVPVWRYFVPDALQTALLLFVPLGLWAVLREVLALLRPVFTRRRFAARWQREGMAPGAKASGVAPPSKTGGKKKGKPALREKSASSPNAGGEKMPAAGGPKDSV